MKNNDKNLLIKFIVNLVALGLTAFLLKGIEINGIFPLVISTILLGVLNTVIRPIFLVLTLPLNLLTLGSFTFVINGMILLFTSQLVRGFEITSFWSGLFGAILLSFISFLLDNFINNLEEKIND
ncbi:phage holin family protein [Haliovirga abyssi]|uniref:Membrane protein n=1 Tax=Haliovirga abyssi TaxID=2996794 RepID=A0AAU9DTF5_9FUSO|nr:phage holin family protein [Haliovirga abyssi]BDU50439.1 membrane protein [Haliovirga abyssi]